VLTATGTAGTINGEVNFTFDGTTAYINGALGVGTNTPTTVGLIRATNDVIAFYSSDIRLKENINLIKNPIEKIVQIGGYQYDWIPMEGIHENEGHDIGVIAQEIEKVIPEVVTRRENGYLAVKYDKIVALLIECVKEQQTQIDELKNIIKK
jgi:methionine aminopeptidase